MVSVGARVEAEFGAAAANLMSSQVTAVPDAGLRISIKLSAAVRENHWTQEQIKISLKQARLVLDREAYLHFRDQALAAVRQAALDLHGADSVKKIEVRSWHDQTDDDVPPLVFTPFGALHMCFLPAQSKPEPNNGLDATLRITVHRHPHQALYVGATEHDKHSRTYTQAVLSTPGYPIP